MSAPVDDQVRKKVRPNGGRALPPMDRRFYHWSPTTSRKGILREGFQPGKWSLAHDWKPPYVCFSDDPHLAWCLSGDLYPEIPSWDLWMVEPYDYPYEAILEMSKYTHEHYIKEYRVYVPIKKADTHYIASRVGGRMRAGRLLP